MESYKVKLVTFIRAYTGYMIKPERYATHYLKLIKRDQIRDKIDISSAKVLACLKSTKGELKHFEMEIYQKDIDSCCYCFGVDELRLFGHYFENNIPKELTNKIMKSIEINHTTQTITNR